MSLVDTIDISTLNTREKLNLMDRLWADLSKHPEEIEVPERHLRIVREREIALVNGETEFIDFEEAMSNIRSRIEARRLMK